MFTNSFRLAAKQSAFSHKAGAVIIMSMEEPCATLGFLL